MYLSGLSREFFRNAGMALVLVFAASAAMIPAEADAGQKKKPVAAQKASPKASPKKASGNGAKKKQAPKILRAYLYMNAETGDVLEEFNARMPLEPASLTKEVTAMVVFDALRSGQLRLDQRLPLASAGAVERRAPVLLRNRAGLALGAQLSVDELLQATAVASAADATVTLAKGICGSEACFVSLMNRKVREILGVPPDGKSTTIFTNSHGMPGNRSTAFDLARIHRHMIREYPDESRYFGATSYSVNGQSRPGHNAPLAEYTCESSVGLSYKCLERSKTGFIGASGSCIVGDAIWNGYHVIGIEMGHGSAVSRNRVFQQGLDRNFRLLEAANAPKTAPRPSRFPPLLPLPLGRESGAAMSSQTAAAIRMTPVYVR